MTTAQLQVLKADILANGDLNTIPNTSDGNAAIAALYNLLAVPDFWAWRTKVTQLEIVTATTADGTAWSWPDFISRSQGERDGWREMFAGGASVNAALPNTRQGFSDIFSGPSGVNQRAHLLATGRRKATRAEKLFATGTGSTASPGVMTVEGPLNGSTVEQARAT